MALATDEVLGAGRSAILITPGVTTLPRMRGIQVGATGGTITGVMRDDTVSVTLTLNAGFFYPFDFATVTAAVATTLHAIR